MDTPLIRNELRRTDHRLVWWLLGHQDKDESGRGLGVVRKGWRIAAARELDLSDEEIFRAQCRLRNAGVIECAKWQREVRLNGDAFAV